MLSRSVVAALFLSSASVAHAGDVPLRQPAPVWASKADLDLSKSDADAPALLIFDNQHRIEKGRLWVYSDTATRIVSADMLAQFATLSLPWMPDKGDLIIHDLTIYRAGQAIDLLAAGKNFTVLRREQGLEQRQLTGLLSATMPVEGLEVGDILRLRYSVSMADTALAGNVQSIAPIIASPMRLGFGRLKVQWDSSADVRWKLIAQGMSVTPTRKNGYSEILLPLPIAKPADMPADAPLRFRQPPMLEVSTFPDWQAVSRVMAPLYATQDLIKKDSPLDRKLAEIKALPTPLAKAQRALQMVQDDVRYLALGMNGGNYTPQKPEESWALRYGDCKAKTLLLLALLRGAGIEAEAAMVNSQLGDLTAQRLPSVAAFDHVIVRTVIDGETLWLDGTGTGARIEDIRDTPPFRHALPLRTAGADLMEIRMRAPVRPSIEVAIDADESTSVDLPSAFKVSAVMRGPQSAQLSVISSQLDSKQRDKFIGAFFSRIIGEGQYSNLALTSDPTTATTTISARGATTKLWYWQDKHMERSVSKALDDLTFEPDRAKALWSSIPVATPNPEAMRFRLRLRLPNGGRGFAIEGEKDAKAHIAGRDISRSMTLVGDILTLEERVDTTGEEIAVADIPKARDQLAIAKTQLPRLVAPTDTMRSWDLKDRDPAGATQLAAIEDVFAKAIANAEPDDVSAYLARANLRNGVGNREAALLDIGKAIAVEPNQQNYLQRAYLYRDLGRLQEAVADAEKAVAIDPSDQASNSGLADLLGEAGQLGRAKDVLDQRIALGGKARDDYRRIKAGIIGDYGDPQEALKLYDELIVAKPGNPDLLNGRCWLKARRVIMIETALKDCTSAIELSESAAAALDSRALVWFRMARYEDALNDLNAVLSEQPGMASSLYMRSIVLSRLGKKQEGAQDRAAAEKMSPRIKIEYDRYDIKP